MSPAIFWGGKWDRDLHLHGLSNLELTAERHESGLRMLIRGPWPIFQISTPCQQAWLGSNSAAQAQSHRWQQWQCCTAYHEGRERTK